MCTNFFTSSRDSGKLFEKAPLVSRLEVISRARAHLLYPIRCAYILRRPTNSPMSHAIASRRWGEEPRLLHLYRWKWIFEHETARLPFSAADYCIHCWFPGYSSSILLLLIFRHLTRDPISRYVKASCIYIHLHATFKYYALNKWTISLVYNDIRLIITV